MHTVLNNNRIRLNNCFINAVIFIIICLLPLNCLHAELLMQTHGHLTLAPYIHGKSISLEHFPGHRSEFMSIVDLFNWDDVIFNSQLGNTTVITQLDDNLKLDKIRYNLTPGIRVEKRDLIIRFALNHECIHVVSRFNETGSIFWNSLQIGVGTKGAYYLYLRESLKPYKDEIVNSWDAQINFGYIIPAEGTLLTGQNHEYNYELFSQVRYQFAVVRNWAVFAGLNQHSWMKTDGESLEHKVDFTLNFFRKGTIGFAGIFYNYTIFDSYEVDNTEGMGALGFKLIF